VATLQADTTLPRGGARVGPPSGESVGAPGWFHGALLVINILVIGVPVRIGLVLPPEWTGLAGQVRRLDTTRTCSATQIPQRAGAQPMWTFFLIVPMAIGLLVRSCCPGTALPNAVRVLLHPYIVVTVVSGRSGRACSTGRGHRRRPVKTRILVANVTSSRPHLALGR